MIFGASFVVVLVGAFVINVDALVVTAVVEPSSII